jgi:predicted site-specific integrase-resolvase
MPAVINEGSYYPTVQVCRMLGISTNALFSWLKEGAFPYVEYRDCQGWRLFSTVQVEGIRAKANDVLAISRSS